MIALIRSAISDRSRHAFPVEPRVVGVAGLLCVPGTGLWGWSDSSRRWYTRHSRVTAVHRKCIYKRRLDLACGPSCNP